MVGVIIAALGLEVQPFFGTELGRQLGNRPSIDPGFQAYQQFQNVHLKYISHFEKLNESPQNHYK